MDLSGFTALTDTSGDEHAVSVLTWFRATVRDTCSRRGVRIAKWLGDGAMLVGVETTPVVEAALELLFHSGPEPVGVRCGVTTGRVILLEGDDYVGHPVNIAARLCDVAGAGEVLASLDLVPHLPKWADVREAVELSVRGIGNPVEVVRLGLRTPQEECSLDPVCGIPLGREFAFEVRSPAGGDDVLFCSESCLETWIERDAGSHERDPGSSNENALERLR